MNEGYIIAGLLLLTAGMIDFLWIHVMVRERCRPDHKMPVCLAVERLPQNQRRPRKGSEYGRSTAVMPDVSDMDHSILERMGADFLERPSFTCGSSIERTGFLVRPNLFFRLCHVYFRNGDLAPNGGLWKLVTVIETAQGLLTITFSVTYLISVLSAVNQKRSFAQSVLSLGVTEQKSSIMHGMAKTFTTLIFFLSPPHQSWES